MHVFSLTVRVLVNLEQYVQPEHVITNFLKSHIEIDSLLFYISPLL